MRRRSGDFKQKPVFGFSAESLQFQDSAWSSWILFSESHQNFQWIYGQINKNKRLLLSISSKDWYRLIYWTVIDISIKVIQTIYLNKILIFLWLPVWNGKTPLINSKIILFCTRLSAILYLLQLKTHFSR